MSATHTCTVSSFCASLIPQPWMQNKKHTVSTRCEVCKQNYYCWHLQKWFRCKVGPEEISRWIQEVDNDGRV